MAMLRATKVEGHGLRHRLDEGRHLDLLCLLLRTCRALDGTRKRGGAGALRLRQPCRPRPASGARSRSRWARASKRSATCRTTGPAPSSSACPRTCWSWIAATNCTCWKACPLEWLKAGMVTRLNGVLTPFGPLRMTVRVDRQGKTATLEVEPLAANCKSVVVHLPDGTLRRLPPTEGGTLTFDVRRLPGD